MAEKQLQFGGEEPFDAPPERLFDTLTDFDSIAETIPDLESAERADDKLNCVVRPGFSFLRGKLNLEITLSDLERPERATMHMRGKGIGAKMHIVSEMHITPANGGSVLNWQATVDELSGLIATVSRPLIQAAAERVITETWAKVRAKLKLEE